MMLYVILLSHFLLQGAIAIPQGNDQNFVLPPLEDLDILQALPLDGPTDVDQGKPESNGVSPPVDVETSAASLTETPTPLLPAPTARTSPKPWGKSGQGSFFGSAPFGLGPKGGKGGPWGGPWPRPSSTTAAVAQPPAESTTPAAAGQPEATGSTPFIGPKQIWQPKAGAKFQIVLGEKIIQLDKDTPLVPDAEVFDVDLFHTPKSVIQELNARGRSVICYFSAGGSESWRPDDNEFKAKDIGDMMREWEGERWLDIRSPDVFAVMKKRIELAYDKGCKGIDPDNLGER
jgi:Glycoside-hydrolase family GH114